MNMSELIFVGNHAKLELKEGKWSALQSISFVSDAQNENGGGYLVYGKRSNNKIECNSYTLEDLKKSMELLFSHHDSIQLILDPTEWISVAAIHSLIQMNKLTSVYFIYPVGMAALDSRKEIAEVVLLLKTKGISTFLIRDFNKLFAGTEPNERAFVERLKEQGSKSKLLVYLCGEHMSERQING